MTAENKNHLIVYTFKKNHLKIYSEFLDFQSLYLENIEQVATQKSEKNRVKNINYRNFNALYWIVLYLKDIKGNSLTLIYEFFIEKSWITWTFKNFSYHYYKLIKLEKIQAELNQLQLLVDQEESYLYCDSPVTQQSAPTKLPTVETKIYKPRITGNHQDDIDTTIHLNSTLEESRERLLRSKEKAMTNTSDITD